MSAEEIKPLKNNELKQTVIHPEKKEEIITWTHKKTLDCSGLPVLIIFLVIIFTFIYPYWISVFIAENAKQYNALLNSSCLFFAKTKNQL